MTGGPRRAPRTALAAVAVLLALAWSAMLAVWHREGRASALDRLEAPLLDIRSTLVGPRPAPPDVVILALDDETVRSIGRYPLPRSEVARIVRAAARHEPKAVALDILFLDRGAEDADRALAEALRDAGAVIAAAGLFPPGAPAASDAAGPFGDAPLVERVLWPTERLAREAGVGLVNVTTDHAGTPRHAPLVLRHGATLLPSFPLRVATRAAGADPVIEPGRVTLGGVITHADLGFNLPFRFYGPRGAIRTVSAAALLRGEVDAGALANRIVVIGATAVGTGDTFTTPFDPVLPGVEVLATAIAHLTNGDGLVRDGRSRAIDAAAAVALATGAALALALAPPTLGLALAGAGAAAWLALTVFAFRDGFWLSAILPLAAMVPVALFCLVGRQALDGSRTRRLARAEAAFRRFQPPALADRIAGDPAFLAEPVAQDAAVVFVDLSGFTRLSERLGVHRTREFLKGFHALVEAVVDAHQGLVVSFMGDGAMIVFGVPEPGPDDARRAIEAASDLVARIGEWLAARPGAEADLAIRVGAHHGPVVVSRLGAATHQHITATGDSVNVASRLLEVAKGLGAVLVASEDLVRAAGEAGAERPPFDGSRAVAIRGRRQPLTVCYRLARRRAPGRSEGRARGTERFAG